MKYGIYHSITGEKVIEKTFESRNDAHEWHRDNFWKLGEDTCDPEFEKLVRIAGIDAELREEE